MKMLVHANATNVETVQAVSHDVISLYIHICIYACMYILIFRRVYIYMFCVSIKMKTFLLLLFRTLCFWNLQEKEIWKALEMPCQGELMLTLETMYANL